MTVRPKIIFDHRKARTVEDVTDLMELLFPGNPRQRYAAARIVLSLKAAGGVPYPLHEVAQTHGLSRRILERTRAKLARLGLIERVTWMNSRYGGRNGWKLSGRMSAGLRALADRIDQWRQETGPGRNRKEEALVELLRPTDNAFLSPGRGSVAVSRTDRGTEAFKNSS
jgi:hypothetical protein